jgi:hypothetical protein
VNVRSALRPDVGVRADGEVVQAARSTSAALAVSVRSTFIELLPSTPLIVTDEAISGR